VLGVGSPSERPRLCTVADRRRRRFITNFITNLKVSSNAPRKGVMPDEIASPFTDAGETAMAELLGNEVLPSSFVKFRQVSSPFTDAGETAMAELSGSRVVSAAPRYSPSAQIWAMYK
jgi:hypothetical protein